MKKRFFRYPKLTALIIVIIFAYILFKKTEIGDFIINLNGLSYLGIFIAGMLYTFGFTSPFSAGFFLTLNPENIFIAGIIAGVGAMVSDLFIFKFVRFSFKNEFERLKNEKIIRKFRNFTKKIIHKKIRKILLYLLAGSLIASPLPDEAGLVIIAETKIKAKILGAISLILNTIGILVILWIGK